MTDWLWLPHPRPAARIRLYCFASAGAGAGAFGRWGAVAPDELEIAAIQLPGRETRLHEAPLRSMAAAAATIAPIIENADRRPFALFGHSAGARLAMHVAAHLDCAGHRPTHVFASGAPWTITREDLVHRLDDAAFVRRVSERYGALPAEVTGNPRIWAVFEPSMRADLVALETDDVTPRSLPIALTVISGSRDAVVDDVEPARWQAWSDRPIRHDAIDADHFSYRTSPRPYIDVICRYLLTDRAR